MSVMKFTPWNRLHEVSYMKYICRDVLGSLSQYTYDVNTPNVPIIQAYEKVHSEVLQKLEGKIPPEELNDLDCVVKITSSSGNYMTTNFPSLWLLQIVFLGIP